MNIGNKYSYYKEMFVLGYDCKEYLFDSLIEAKEFIESNSIEVEFINLSDIGFIDENNYEILEDITTIIL